MKIIRGNSLNQYGEIAYNAMKRLEFGYSNNAIISWNYSCDNYNAVHNSKADKEKPCPKIVFLWILNYVLNNTLNKPLDVKYINKDTKNGIYARLGICILNHYNNNSFTSSQLWEEVKVLANKLNIKIVDNHNSQMDVVLGLYEDYILPIKINDICHGIHIK